MPKVRKGESKSAYIKRAVKTKEMEKYANDAQRRVVAAALYDKAKGKRRGKKK